MSTKSFDLVKDAIRQNGDAIFHCFTKVDHHIAKKNKRPIHRMGLGGRPFIGKSPDLRMAESHLEHVFRIAGLRQKGFEVIARPMWCVFLFYFPQADYFTKKGVLSGRMPDLSNLYELPQDALQKSGVIKNDNLICSHDLSRRLPGEEYALETFIFEYPLGAGTPLKILK